MNKSEHEKLQGIQLCVCVGGGNIVSLPPGVPPGDHSECLRKISLCFWQGRCQEGTILNYARAFCP